MSMEERKFVSALDFTGGWYLLPRYLFAESIRFAIKDGIYQLLKVVISKIPRFALVTVYT